MTQTNTSLKTRRIGIVVAQFNQVVTDRLLAGAQEALEQAGISRDRQLVVSVPGAIELARTAKLMADQHQVDGIIALGAVIRGATSHYDYVCAETAHGLAEVSLNGPVPVMFGVLTTDDLYQALDRAGGKVGNKGRDCAAGVLTMLDVQDQLATHQ